MWKAVPMKVTVLLAALISIGLLSTSWAQFGRESESPPMSQWEYHTFETSQPNEGDLNNLAKKGWELVDFEHKDAPHSGYICVFRRATR